MLAIFVDQDQWRISRAADSKKITPPSGTPGRYTFGADNYFDLGNAIGSWTDWAIHVKFAYTAGDGFLQIWKNGVKIMDNTDPNCFNDDIGPYLLFGVYKWEWKSDYVTNTDERLYYFDEFRIGDAEATYEDVAPGGPQGETVILHHGESHTFADLEPGDYLVSGNMPAGWALAENDFAITLAAGDNVVMAFQYTKIVGKASITVSVETDTGDTTQEFEITLTKV